jgi:DNA-directed RNA polymerase subunit RPC12/RpoP
MTDQTSSQINPDEQTITLRCSRCNKPITPEEAVQTPTGYRCRECVRQQQKVFDTSKPLDSLWGFLIAATLSFAGSYLTSVIGFFTFLLAPAAGVAVAEVVRAATGKRRSKRLFRLVSAGMILGGAPLILVNLFNLVLRLNAGAFSLFGLLPLGYQVLYLVLAVPSAYYRLSGSRRSR